MPVRVIHKGDTQHAAHVAKTALCMMAALAVPACLMGMVHARRTIALCSARGNPTPVEVCCMLASWSDSLRSVTQLRLLSALPAAQGAPSLRIKIGPDSCTFHCVWLIARCASWRCSPSWTTKLLAHFVAASSDCVLVHWHSSAPSPQFDRSPHAS